MVVVQFRNVRVMHREKIGPMSLCIIITIII